MHKPGNVIPSGGSFTVIFVSDLADHPVQISSGNCAIKSTVQPTDTKAAFFAVFQVVDFFSEMPEIQRPDFLGAWLFYCRSTCRQSSLPTHQCRIAQVKLMGKAAVGQRISLFQLSDHGQRLFDTLIFFPPGPCRVPVSSPSVHPLRPFCALAVRCPGGAVAADLPAPASLCPQAAVADPGVDP